MPAAKWLARGCGEMADEDMREMVDAIQEAYLIAKKNNKKYTPKKYRKDE